MPCEIYRRVAAPERIDGEHRFSGSASGSSSVLGVRVRYACHLPHVSSYMRQGLGPGRQICVRFGASLPRDPTGVGTSRDPFLRSGAFGVTEAPGPFGGLQLTFRPMPVPSYERT